MKTLSCCSPRQSVLDGSEDFVVNLSKLPELTEPEATEFLDANVLTSGMEELVMQAFDRLSGGPSRGIFKLSESMGGGKTQSMIVAGLLARFPKLAKSLPFKTQPKAVKPDQVIAFTGRSTDEVVWVTIGKQLGADFAADSAPSEKQWAALFEGKSVLILLDELAFYLVHAASKGTKDQGERFSTRRCCRSPTRLTRFTVSRGRRSGSRRMYCIVVNDPRLLVFLRRHHRRQRPRANHHLRLLDREGGICFRRLPGLLSLSGFLFRGHCDLLLVLGFAFVGRTVRLLGGANLGRPSSPTLFCGTLKVPFATSVVANGTPAHGTPVDRPHCG